MRPYMTSCHVREERGSRGGLYGSVGVARNKGPALTLGLTGGLISLICPRVVRNNSHHNSLTYIIISMM